MKSMRVFEVVGVFMFAVAFALTACSSDDSTFKPRAGILTMPLFTTTITGNQYRLIADFQIVGTDSVTIPAADHQDEAVLQVELPEGDYQLTIGAGWIMEQLVDGVWVPVEAEL